MKATYILLVMPSAWRNDEPIYVVCWHEGSLVVSPLLERAGEWTKANAMVAVDQAWGQHKLSCYIKEKM
jgi:hypothetical protein